MALFAISGNAVAVFFNDLPPKHHNELSSKFILTRKGFQRSTSNLQAPETFAIEPNATTLALE
jgi:hypothetical protein